MKPLQVLLVISGLLGCTSLKNAATNAGTNLRLEIVETLIPGKTTKNEVTSLFGSPNRIEKLKSQKGGGVETENWHYDGAAPSRLMFSFEGISDVVRAIDWNFSEQDAEKNILQIQNRYKDRRWQPRAADSASPHYYPDECYLEDTTGGMSIHFKRSDHSATSVSWWDSSRRPSNFATQSRQAKKRSCIGDGCTEFTSSQLDQILCGLKDQK